MSELSLYPSNWLYNAGVIGFLRVLEWGGKKFSLKDGRVILNKELISESFELRLQFHKEVLGNEGAVWGNNRLYPNYIQFSQKEFFINYYVPSLSKIESSGYCSFCDGFFLPSKEIENLRKKWKGKQDGFESFMEQRVKFQIIHSRLLGASLGEMPNSFWNLNLSLPICHLCSYLIIFHHLAFTRTSDGEIFINAPDFRLMWYLNKFAREVVGREGGKDVRKIFGLSLMQWAIRISQTLGAWTMANVEVIRKWRKEKEEFIDHFELSYDVVRVLMDPTAASLLQSIGSWPILELVMTGRFSELLLAAYCTARALLLDNIPKNHCIKKYGGGKDTAGEMFSRLPLLFSRIKEIVKEGSMSNYSDAWRLKEAGQRLKLKGEFERSVFRILELTRLGKINDAYQAILRILVANKKPVPEELVKILQVEDIEIKKSYIYAFLSGVLGKEEGGE